MRCCVVLAVLLSLVLFSKGNSDTTPDTTPSASTASEGNSDTTPDTTPSASTASEGNSDATPETTPSARAGSEGNSDTTPDTTPSASTASEGINTIAETTAWTTTESEARDFCNPDPCGKKLARCVALNSTFTCRCQYGFYFLSGNCHAGKIFPGVITLNVPYSSSVQTVNSLEYEEMFNNITVLFEDAFKGLGGFAETVIVEIQQIQSESRASSPVSVTVTNLFMDNSNVTNQTVTEAIDAEIKDSKYVSKYTGNFEGSTIQCWAFFVLLRLSTSCIKKRKKILIPKLIVDFNLLSVKWLEKSGLNIYTYCASENKPCSGLLPDYFSFKATTYCAAFKCDTQTTRCEEAMHPVCLCQDDYAKTEWDERSCSDCSESCSSEQNKYCERAGGVPTCKCMANFKKKNGSCVPCPVGYAGEDCKDNTELILIILGTVLGAIILSLLIAVSIVSVRNKHRQDPEQKRLIKSEYSNSNSYADDRQTTMFPRVQTTSGHANPGYQPNNPYETCSTNRGQYDDLYEISRGHEGFRMQSRY
ncbi:mucin-13 [Guaruba guarouba]